MMELFYPSRDLKKKMSLLLNFYQTNIFGSVSMISMGKKYSPIHMKNRKLESIGHAVYIDGSSKFGNDFDQSKSEFKGNLIDVICGYFPTGN